MLLVCCSRDGPYLLAVKVDSNIDSRAAVPYMLEKYAEQTSLHVSLTNTITMPSAIQFFGAYTQ
jgi:hypothetical protein